MIKIILKEILHFIPIYKKNFNFIVYCRFVYIFKLTPYLFAHQKVKIKEIEDQNFLTPQKGENIGIF